MKLKVLIFLSLISLTSILAGGPSSVVPSLPCDDKFCAGQCLSNGESLKSCSQRITLEVTLSGQLNLFTQGTSEIGGAIKAFYANKANCAEVKMCLDFSGRFTVNACDDEAYSTETNIENGCVQVNDDGRVYVLDQNGEIGVDFINDISLIDY